MVTPRGTAKSFQGMEPTSGHYRKIVSELEEIVAHAGVDEYLWQEFCDRFSTLIPGTSALLYVNDKKAQRGAPFLYSGIDESYIHLFAERYAQINPWTAFNEELPLFEMRRTEDFLPASSFHDSEFYEDFLRHIPDIDAATAVKFWNERDRDIELGAHYDSRKNDAMNRIVEPVLKALVVPMRRSFDLLRIDMTDRQARGRTALMESIASAALLVSKDRRVLSANQQAQMLAADCCFFEIGAKDNLIFSDPSVAREFDAKSAQLFTNNAIASYPACIKLAEGSRHFMVSLFRLADATAGIFGTFSGSTSCMLVIIGLAPNQSQDAQNEIRRRFGLTGAEARLAIKVASGASIADASQALGVSYQTARSQMRDIYAKLNIHRQTELVIILREILKFA